MKKKNKAQKKHEIAAPEIRIGEPTAGVYNTVKKLAQRENRGIGKQADYMLKQYIEQNKL